MPFYIKNALSKDYSYLLSSNFAGKNLVIKIPMSAEGEFENKYSIDDLLIGNVGIIGVYKGAIKGVELNSTFDFFVNLGNVAGQTTEIEEEIQSSSDDVSIQPYNLSTTLKDNVDYIFIDLLAVFQSIKVNQPNLAVGQPQKKNCFLKRWFRGKKK